MARWPVRPHRSSASGAPPVLGLHFADFLHDLRAVAQYRRSVFFWRGGALSRLSTKGLGIAEVGLLVAFCSFTFFLGTVLLGGRPDLRAADHRALDGPARLGRPADRRGMLSGVALYAAGSLFHFRPLKIGGFELVYPALRLAARQLLAAPLELIGAAGIIYFALPRRAIRVSSSCLAYSSPPSRSRLSAMRRAALGCWNLLSSRRCRTPPPPNC